MPRNKHAGGCRGPYNTISYIHESVHLLERKAEMDFVVRCVLQNEKVGRSGLCKGNLQKGKKGFWLQEARYSSRRMNTLAPDA